MADGRHFEKNPVKSLYLSNRLTNFDEVWQGGEYWPLTADRPLKFRIFKNSRYRRPPSRKSQKSRYLRNGLTDVYKIWYADARWSPAPEVKFKFLIFDNLMRRIAATLRIEKLLKYIL